MQKITPNLWFDNEAEEAANYYVSIFKNSKINKTAHYGSAGPLPSGTVMMVEFELNGVSFTALNGGPADFAFNPSISFIIHCDSQEEVDYYWDALSKEGKEDVCGWVYDKYGVGWQIIPIEMDDMITDPDPEKSQRAMSAMLQMRKINIEELKQAFEGAVI